MQTAAIKSANCSIGTPSPRGKVCYRAEAAKRCQEAVNEGEIHIFSIELSCQALQQDPDGSVIRALLPLSKPTLQATLAQLGLKRRYELGEGYSIYSSYGTSILCEQSPDLRFTES